MVKAWLVACILVAPLTLASADGASHAAPAPASSAWWRTTLLDEDRDQVDDALAATLATGPRDPLVVLVDYAAMPTRDERAALAARCAITNEYAHFPIVAARCEPGTVRGLLRLPGVVFVEENDVLVPLLKESVTLIGADQAWIKYRTTGKGISIAVLDDGAFEQHPDLKDKIVGDFDAGAPSALPLGNSPIGLVSPAGEEGHGTHVAGIALGPGLQSGGTYRGVAPDATLVNVKVFSGPNQTTSDIVLRGLDWTLSHMVQFKIRTATMSLGGRASDGQDALSRAVDLAVDKGLIVVAAAGNTGPGPKSITAPGASAKAITVGAVDKQKRIAEFSSRGPTLDGRIKPDIVAPGVAITSTIPPTSTSTVGGLTSGTGQVWYGALSGTSMATPHVAGIVALMLQANSSLSPQKVKEILLVTAQDNAKPGIDNDTGFGFVNAVAAVQVAKDPSILKQAQYKDRLAAVPNPPPETPLAKLNFAAQKLERDPNFLLYAGLGVLAAAALITVVAVVLAKRKRAPPSAPPPPP